jgi:hypothetical protein
MILLGTGTDCSMARMSAIPSAVRLYCLFILDWLSAQHTAENRHCLS